MPEISRRTALAYCAALGASAGCLGSGSRGGDATTRDTSTTTTATTTATGDDALAVGESATVAQGDVTVQDATAHLVVTVGGSDHADLVGDDGVQYLVAAVKVSFGTPVNCVLEDPPFALFLDDDRYDVAMACLYEYEWDENQGPVAFEVPRDVEFDAGRLTWLGDDGQPAVSWRLPDAAAERLHAPPSFAVRSFEVPAEAASGATVEASFTVENAGDGPGEFVYQFGTGTRTRSEPRDFGVAPGERVTETRQVTASGDPGTQLAVTLDWGFGSASRTLDVVDGH